MNQIAGTPYLHFAAEIQSHKHAEAIVDGTFGLVGCGFMYGAYW
jgi:uncharacterized protein YkwD